MGASKNDARKKRHRRVRKKVSGTTEKPRLNVFRSLKHIYVQVIDDNTGVTLAAASTADKEFKSAVKIGSNIEAAKTVGTAIAKKAIGKGVTKVIFDRGGYIYHGRVKALAEAAREGGLKF
ncbi:MAG TPA: 50S ribosomal protein L18 [Nitrospirae bacterium]|nr:50S ribosomal protein L18 [bacterium BMS3Abin09]GBE41500.1 50S ribosomal protein L18 [bacterium BMS3Bbin09]HDH34726.1 50S ribosomal protein L18 [Nitrospirota bacterium]HDN94780.1 50S ribosomal protein L18 [Nitrospirota bacterium]HDO66648.1 50S ribosomal protein L18 [Nitrospirota bacterium]